MNPRLGALNPYPFERLRQLLAQSGPTAPNFSPISLSIGEPRHPAPLVAIDAMRNAMDGLSAYPPTKGEPALREAISSWIARRYGIPAPDPDTQVLPVLGSREALFAVAQTVIDPVPGALVVCPNPFYQIYEGAALIAGARPYFINSQPELNFGYDWQAVPPEVWRHTQLLFICSPGNPAGNVLPLESWRTLFRLSDEYGFVIAADECYSEIYFDEAAPPLGALQAAHQLGRDDFRRLLCFSSLSKRSNVPGMRSGFVAGDAALVRQFLLYRTYHGSAMSPVVSRASVAAWNDEAHVAENRRLYRNKFEAVYPILKPVLDVEMPDAGFYLWAGTPGGDEDLTRELYAATAVTVLPGSYLAREAHGINPGTGRIRIALVAPEHDCVEAAQRMARFLREYTPPR